MAPNEMLPPHFCPHGEELNPRLWIAITFRNRVRMMDSRNLPLLSYYCLYRANRVVNASKIVSLKRFLN